MADHAMYSATFTCVIYVPTISLTFGSPKISWTWLVLLATSLHTYLFYAHQTHPPGCRRTKRQRRPRCLHRPRGCHSHRRLETHVVVSPNMNCWEAAQGQKKQNLAEITNSYFNDTSNMVAPPFRTVNFRCVHETFRSFRMFLEVLVRFSHVLAPVWMCLDASRCVRMSSEVFGNLLISLKKSRKYSRVQEHNY